MDNRSQIINPQTGVAFSDTDSVSAGPLTVEQFPSLTDEELRVLRLTAEASLADGHSPQVGVALPLQAMVQIVVTIDELKAERDEMERELCALYNACGGPIYGYSKEALDELTDEAHLARFREWRKKQGHWRNDPGEDAVDPMEQNLSDSLAKSWSSEDMEWAQEKLGLPRPSCTGEE